MLEDIARIPPLASAFAEQKRVIDDFFGAGNNLLAGVVPLSRPPEGAKAFERNFFSSLFLATFAALGMEQAKRSLYGLVNQCLRAWVTGCDNILDGDDRVVFPIDLPGEGYRFKAVLTVMTADRVLAERLLEAVSTGILTLDQATRLQRISLACLVPSGMQEHDEEAGVKETLPPGAILHEIHAIKTGRLFEAPLVVPQILDDLATPATEFARRGLHSFGLGCQIIDDIADVGRDLLQERHNYLASLCVHDDGLDINALRGAVRSPEDLTQLISPSLGAAADKARRLMHMGLDLLGNAGLSLDRGARDLIIEAMFPLLLEKDLDLPAPRSLASAGQQAHSPQI